MIILPTPKKVIYKTGSMKISDKINIINNISSSLAKLAIDKLFRSFPNLTINEKGWKLNFKIDQSLKDQEYRLEINENEVIISSSSDSGCFYGITTLKQILKQKENNEIPCLVIEDCPDFLDRGLMLDISRNRVYKVETIYRIIDMLSDLKLNQLQFNVEGNSYYYPSKNKYYKNGNDYLTEDDVRNIDEYCKKNFVHFIPNQNSFGHMCYWLNQREFTHLAECPEGFTYKWMINSPSTTLNPLLPDSFNFVTSMYDEILKGYSERVFNIGGDEPFELGFGKSKDEVEKYGREKVYFDFILKLYNYLKNKGYKIMMWGDVIKNTTELLHLIPKDIIALEWGYDENDFSDEVLQRYVQNGFKYYVCPGTSMWNSIAGIHYNMIKNIKRAAILGKKNQAYGLLNTDWGDGGSWQQLSLSYIPYLYGCCYSWNADAEQDDLILDYLNKFVFLDESNKFAKFLLDLGMYSKIEKIKDSNSTNLFKMLYIQQTDHINFGHNLSDPFFIIKDTRRLTTEEYKDYIKFFTNKLKEFNDINLKCDDKEIIENEVLFALKILLVGARLGVYVTDLYSHNLDEFKSMINMLNEAKNHYNYTWDKRNKKSDYDLSMLRMNDLYRKLNAIINE
jgi:hypothetical protein